MSNKPSQDTKQAPKSSWNAPCLYVLNVGETQQKAGFSSNETGAKKCIDDPSLPGCQGPMGGPGAGPS